MGAGDTIRNPISREQAIWAGTDRCEVLRFLNP
jgi:hypothetical protein